MTMEQHEQYEGLFVLDGEQSDEALTKAQQQIVEQIARLGGTVERRDPWGKRRLAYRVRRRRDGFYLLVVFRIPSAAVAPLDQWCALNELILRRLILRGASENAQPMEAMASHG